MGGRTSSSAIAPMKTRRAAVDARSASWYSPTRDNSFVYVRVGGRGGGGGGGGGQRGPP